MLTMFYAIDDSHPNANEHDQRVEDCQLPVVGALTWMGFKEPIREWEILSTHLFKSADSKQSVCFVEVAKGEVVDRYLPTAIELYMLDGQLYSYAICGGQLSPPQIGPFEEYTPAWGPADPTNFDPIPSKRLPIDKRIANYEALSGDSAMAVYVVQLERLPTLVAA